MVSGIASFVSGVLAWTFVEYVIHAWLSHTFKTFATPFHDGHHRDPHRVFTIRAWIPVAVIWVGGLVIFGWSTGMIFLTGMVAGFVAYETAHYRIHFSEPRTVFERHLRSRHLVHHYREPNAGFGVTTELWDLVFGSEIMGDEMRHMEASVAATAPLEGPTNVRRLLYLGMSVRG
jgi:sterol desaturase/sphingolipid hydroxylase (fatty acid hydroxylase superfamily)